MRHLLDNVDFAGWGSVDTAITHALLEAVYLQSLPTMLPQRDELPPGRGEGPRRLPPQCNCLLIAPYECHRVPVLLPMKRQYPGIEPGPGKAPQALRPENAWEAVDVLLSFRVRVRLGCAA